MFLGDFQTAIDGIIEYFGEFESFTSITHSWDCSKVIFKNLFDETYLYYIETGRIEKLYADTWRNPNHKDILKEGK